MKSIRKFWQENSFVLVTFILWRLGLFIVGFWAFSFLPIFKASFPYIDEHLIASGFPQWFWHWGNFDGVHYLSIAQNGYTLAGTQVFFPLYPVVIKLVNFVIHSYFLAAFLVSNLSFLAAAIIFANLVARHFGKTVSRWATFFLFLFPTSYYFGSIYSESLFLLLILLAFYLSGVGKWLVSYLAGLTRLVGAFVGGGVAGVASYVVYLWATFGKPTYFLDAQGSFANARANSFATLVSSPQVVWRYLKIFFTADSSHYDYWVAVLEFGAFFLGVSVLGWLTWRRKVPLSWLVFSWAALLLPTFSGTLSSMPRYLVTIFPIFIALAQLPKPWRVLTLVASTILLVVLTTLFVRGYWVA